MRSQYASTITPPPPTINFGNGAITAAKAGNYNAYLQGRNRAGVTAFLTRVDFTVAAGQSINFTLPAAIRQPASDLHEIILSVAKNSTSPSDAVVVATFLVLRQMESQSDRSALKLRYQQTNI